ncbi:TPA: class I SAM-dependent methyltransferase [bacterium]|nr:class I SAM-dependent methyltransferase [bacterium]
MIIDPDIFRANLLKYTTLAFNLIPKINKPTILDVGCGTGVPTIRLAELCNGMIVAIDPDKLALARLTKKLKRKSLLNRVRLLNCQIEKANLDKQTFDIIWAEGSISHLGFKTALELLGQPLNRGGFMVIHDDAFNYLKKIHTIEKLGFSLLGFFFLPESVWWDEYYSRIQAMVSKADSARPPYELNDILNQLKKFKLEPTRFRSAFFIMRKS